MAGLDLQRNDKGEASWVDPRTGETFWVPQQDFDKVYQAGMRPEAPAAYAERQERKDLSSPWLGAGLGALSAISMGALPILLAKTGALPARKQRLIREESPWATGIADVGTTIAGGLVGGPVALAGKLAGKVAAKTALKTGSRAVGKLAGYGTEGAVFSAAKGAEDLVVHERDVFSEEGLTHLAKSGGLGGGFAMGLGAAGMGLAKAAGYAGKGMRVMFDRGADGRIAKRAKDAARFEDDLGRVTGELEASNAVITKLDDTIQIKQTQQVATAAEMDVIAGTQGEAVQAFALHKRLGREVDDLIGPWGYSRAKKGELYRDRVMKGDELITSVQARYTGKKGLNRDPRMHDINKYKNKIASEADEVSPDKLSSWRAKLAKAEGARDEMAKQARAKIAQRKQLEPSLEGLDPKLVTQFDDISARNGKLLDEIQVAQQGRAGQAAEAGKWQLKKAELAGQLDEARQAIKLEQAGSIGRAVGMMQRVAIRARGGGMMFGGAAVMGGGGAMTIMAGMVAPNVMEALAKYAARVVTSPAGMRLGAKVQRATSALAQPKVGAAMRMVTAGGVTDEDWKTIRDEVARFDPKLYLESAAIAAKQTGMVPEVTELTSRTIGVMGYLKETISKPPGDEVDRMSPAEWTPSPAQKRADKARVEGAMNPDAAVMAITREDARPEHFEALARVHPDILESVRRHVGQGIEERKAAGKPIPIETGRQYAMLMNDHRLLPRLYDPKHSERIQAMYQGQREQAKQGARRKAAPQIADKQMTSLQRALEGRA